MVSTGEMTDAEVGKYIRYLMHQWEKGSIPSDPSMIQTIRFDTELWETLETKFPLCEDGRRRNPRLEDIRLEREQYITKRSEAGKVGAKARWDGKRNAIANGKLHGKTIASTSTSTSTPSSSAFPNEKEENIVLTRRKRKLRGPLLDFFNEFWIAFGDKRSRAEAADAWLDIDWPKGKNVEEYFREKILPGAIEYCRYRHTLRSEGQTPKMAQGWISGRRWEDEIPQQTTSKDEMPPDIIAGSVAEEEWMREHNVS